MYNECGEVDGTRNGRRIKITRRKPASFLVCPPQTPHELIRDHNCILELGHIPR
jgi:hypothetical protein